MQTNTDVKKLVYHYVHARSAYMHSAYLEKLVAETSSENYHQIIEWIESHPECHELDISLFILEISNLKFPELKAHITKFKSKFKDPDAIEDLEQALLNLENEDQ